MERPTSDINITPLIDVVLVLLIIFMVLTPLSQSGYNTSVPPIASVPQIPVSQIVVRQSAEGKIYLNQHEMDEDQLITSLGEFFRKNKEETVFFSAADDLNYGWAIRTMDLIRNAGAKKIAVVHFSF